MKTTVTYTAEAAGGKEYPLTITRQHGSQEIETGGEHIPVIDVTVFESKLGTSRCYTRAQPAAPPEERAAALRRIQEAAAQAMAGQGIW